MIDAKQPWLATGSMAILVSNPPMEDKTLLDTPPHPSQHAAEVTEASNNKYQLIVFKLGSEEYAIHIDQIKEVVLTPRVTKMPQTPSYVKGVANIRGSVLAILDLEEKFGIQRDEQLSDESTSNYTLVAESKDFNVGVLVKEVPNTLSVAVSDIDETVNVVQDTDQHGNYMLGIVKMNERLIILIDLHQVMRTNDLMGVFNKPSINP